MIAIILALFSHLVQILQTWTKAKWPDDTEIVFSTWRIRSNLKNGRNFKGIQGVFLLPVEKRWLFKGYLCYAEAKEHSDRVC